MIFIRITVRLEVDDYNIALQKEIKDSICKELQIEPNLVAITFASDQINFSGIGNNVIIEIKGLPSRTSEQEKLFLKLIKEAIESIYPSALSIGAFFIS